jgi:hypothetical protein
MTVTKNEFGQINMFAKEPQMYIDKTEAERYGYETYAERAEKLNGRVAMLGFLAAVISYATTGSIIFFNAFGI